MLMVGGSERSDENSSLVLAHCGRTRLAFRSEHQFRNPRSS